jgi:glycosyltransferase involved in cell wall biosynthesis
MLDNTQDLKTGAGQQQSDSKKKRRFYYRSRYRRKVSSDSSRKPSFIKKISIVIPLLNEENSLRPLTLEIKKVISALRNIEYEIIFVDDGSTDKSANVIDLLKKENKNIKLIQFQKNYGKSAALSIGFKHAIGDVIVTMDADLQDDPREIPNLIKKIEEGYDLVSGWKKVRFDPFIKRTTSKFFNFFTSKMTGIKIHDFNCGLKIYRKEVVDRIKVYGEMHRYLPVLAHWNGFKIGEIVVEHHARRYGRTKFGGSRFIKGFLDLITILFTTRYLKRPLHFFGTIGVFLFLTGFAINLWLVYEWLFQQTYLTNRPMLWLGILLILLGVQTITIGLVGEMIAHNSQTHEDYTIKSIKP